MIEEILITLLVILPFALSWTTFKFWQWSKKYHSSVLAGLALANLTANVASLPIAFFAGRRLLLGEGATPFRGASEIVITAVLMLGSVFILLYLRWRRQFDKDLEDEARNLAEDREFGAKRRELEQAHIEEEETSGL